MKNLSWVLAVAALLSHSAFADSVALGKVEFLVDTNVKLFKFKGQAGELQSKLVHTGPQLTHLELSIPVQSLKTGMDMRDRHMRERISPRQTAKLRTSSSPRIPCNARLNAK